MKKRRKFSINKESVYSLFVIALAGVSLIPLVILCFFSHPSADDYSYSIITFHEWSNSHSIAQLLMAALKTTKHFWNNWQGLYSSAFFLSLQPAIFGEKYYFLTGIIMLFLIIFSTCFFFSYIIKKVLGGSTLDGIAVGSAASFLMVQWMPSCVEGLYWYNGAVNYGLFFAILLLLICAEISLHMATDQKNVIKYTVICCILGFILEGGNHVTAFMGLLFVFGTTIMEIILKNYKRGGYYAGILLFMTVGFLLNVLSPGTKVRQSALTKIDAVSAIKSAISVGIKNINLWLDLAPVIVALLIMPIILKLVICAFKQNNFKFSNPLLLLIGSVMWLCAMYCPSLYATGAAGAGRLQNIVWYSFIILFFINVFYISGWVMNKVDMKYKSNEVAFINAKWICFVLTMLMGLYLAKWNGVWSPDWNGAWSAKAVQELKQGEAQRYSKQAFDRYKVLLNSSAQDVIVKDYSDKPETLFSSDISEDVNHWRNQDLRNYFGLNSVRIEK